MTNLEIRLQLRLPLRFHPPRHGPAPRSASGVREAAWQGGQAGPLADGSHPSLVVGRPARIGSVAGLATHLGCWMYWRKIADRPWDCPLSP